MKRLLLLCWLCVMKEIIIICVMCDERLLISCWLCVMNEIIIMRVICDKKIINIMLVMCYGGDYYYAGYVW